VSRIWSSLGAKNPDSNGAGPPAAAGPGTLPAPFPAPGPGQGPGGQWAPPPPPPGEPDDGYYDDLPTHYVAQPIRPIAQVAARVGLWGAVILGALGGVLGYIRSGDIPPPVESTHNDQGVGVPAPVAGMAERVVREWLVASDQNHARLDSMFVEPPPIDDSSTGKLQVVDTTPVAGARLDDRGYWTVTVAATVVESAGDNGPGAAPTTWYVEVGIVGTIDKGLKALTVPAIVPGPDLTQSRFQPHAPTPNPPSSSDPIATVVEDFLNALLAGQGKTSFQTAPHIHIRPADPAPFVKVELKELSEENIESGKDKGKVRVWALVEATTNSGSVIEAGYELKVIKDIDRWKVVSVWGAPTADPAKPSTDNPDDDTSGSSGSATTDTTDDPATTDATTSTTGFSDGD
jgi:hypothetical protein